jgi:hypothetical protein
MTLTSRGTIVEDPPTADELKQQPKITKWFKKANEGKTIKRKLVYPTNELSKSQAHENNKEEKGGDFEKNSYVKKDIIEYLTEEGTVLLSVLALDRKSYWGTERRLNMLRDLYEKQAIEVYRDTIGLVFDWCTCEFQCFSVLINV